MEYGNGMQYDGYSQGGEGFEMLYNQSSSGQGYSQQQSNCGQGSSNFNGGSASLGGPGYRSPLRYTKMLREMNSRNGLYSPMEQQRSSGQGDYYNTLPGLGGPEGQAYHSRGNGNPYY
ncbi:uncharacterized protein LOC117144799 isoform X1 [Drosophila mauritiana]|uniref:Uncharacterized protein LOC117144799 isoform X1 n=1 Tax=Drosophila mauritiana TaxID=7226 RepID=A0A6P8KQ83_DROMA|nr:uncharacterized protein LOC117144799 isoform X1 [Drosophila mauritiana]